MDFGKSFTYMFDDSEWLKKLAIGGLLALLSIIPVVGASKGCKATPCGYLRHADWPAISAGARGVASVALRPRTRDPCPSLARKKGYQARQKVPKRSSDIGSGPVRMMPSSLAVSKTHCELPALVAADFHANVQAHAAPWKFTYNLWMHPRCKRP